MINAWIVAHASLVALIVAALSATVTIDHTLASTNLFASGSTGQVVLKWIATVAGWGLSLLSPAPVSISGGSSLSAASESPAAASAASPQAPGAPGSGPT